VFTVIIYTTVALFGHKRTFRAAYTAQAIAVGSFLLVDLLWVLATTQVVHPDMLAKVVAKAWTTAIAVAIGSAPWLAYIYRSRRVANTFNR
jgi:putative effector of murein hydrolase